MFSLKIRFFAILLFSTSALTPAYAGFISLTVESAGFESGNYARLIVDGVDLINGADQRGLNVAVLDQIDGSVLNLVAFDTFKYLSESTALVNFINGLDNGRIVMFASKDSPTNGVNFTSDAQISMQSLGASTGNVSDAGFRGSYGFIGIAGAGIGTQTAFEESLIRTAGPVSITDGARFIGVVSVPEPKNLLLFLLLGSTCLVPRFTGRS
jgi:hypothetical protein